MRHLLQRPLRGGKPDALERSLGNRLQPLQRQRQMRAALGRHQRVNLIHNYGIHAAQACGSIGGQQQIQRFRRRDQYLCRMPAKERALLLRGISGAHAIPGSRTATPARRAMFAIPASGERRLRSTSTASAFSGLI